MDKYAILLWYFCLCKHKEGAVLYFTFIDLIFYIQYTRYSVNK